MNGPLRLVVGIVSLVVLVSLTLLVSGKRMLVYETKLNPGDPYVDQESGTSA